MGEQYRPVLDIPWRLKEIWEHNRCKQYEITQALSVLSLSVIFVRERLGFENRRSIGNERNQESQARSKLDLEFKKQASELLGDTGSWRYGSIPQSGSATCGFDLGTMPFDRLVPTLNDSRSERVKSEDCLDIIRNALAHGGIAFSPQQTAGESEVVQREITHIAFFSRAGADWAFVCFTSAALIAFVDKWLETVESALRDPATYVNRIPRSEIRTADDLAA